MTLDPDCYMCSTLGKPCSRHGGVLTATEITSNIKRYNKAPVSDVQIKNIVDRELERNAEILQKAAQQMLLVAALELAAVKYGRPFVENVFALVLERMK